MDVITYPCFVIFLFLRYQYIMWKQFAAYRRSMRQIIILMGAVLLLKRILPINSIYPASSRTDLLVASIARPEVYDGDMRQKPDVIRYDTFPEGPMECLHLNTTETPIICVYNGSTKERLSESVRRGKIREPEIVADLRRYLKKDPGIGLIDIGCNIGMYSIIAASMGHRVVAVDAVRLNALMLAKSVILNRYQDSVTIVNSAISNAYGRLNFSSWPSNRGSARIRTDGMNRPESGFVSIEENVASILMDDLLDVITFQRAIIKIDIEGHEVAALSGANVLFDTLDIPLVISEWWGFRYTNWSMVEAVISYMSSHDYRAESTDGVLLVKRNWRYWPWDILWVKRSIPWWRHQMVTFSALLAICAGNLLVIGEFPTQGPVTRSFDVFFDLRLNNGSVNNREAGYLFWMICNSYNVLVDALFE